jgi:hypothetical protein
MTRHALATALWLASGAAALAGASPGLGPDGKPPENIRVEENSVLPDAGKAGASAAPTMALDCTKTPDQCAGRPINAPQGAGAATSPACPQQSK